jgi:hypothetical protein
MIKPNWHCYHLFMISVLCSYPSGSKKEKKSCLIYSVEGTTTAGLLCGGALFHVVRQKGRHSRSCCGPGIGMEFVYGVSAWASRVAWLHPRIPRVAVWDPSTTRAPRTHSRRYLAQAPSILSVSNSIWSRRRRKVRIPSAAEDSHFPSHEYTTCPVHGVRSPLVTIDSAWLLRLGVFLATDSLRPAPRLECNRYRERLFSIKKIESPSL